MAIINYPCDVKGCTGNVIWDGKPGEQQHHGMVYKHFCDKCGQDYVFTEKRYPMEGEITIGNPE